jgi:hypothetical protein
MADSWYSVFIHGCLWAEAFFWYLSAKETGGTVLKAKAKRSFSNWRSLYSE